MQPRSSAALIAISRKQIEIALCPEGSYWILFSLVFFSMSKFPRPSNNRLPEWSYCNPERYVFVTVRATQGTSPFAKILKSEVHRPTVIFNHGLSKLVLDQLKLCKLKYECDVFIACLMPDHLHLLTRPKHSGANVMTFMDRFKGISTNSSWSLGWKGRLWQPRSFDHVVRHDESLEEKANYIVANPVRTGFVEAWEDWPYTVRWDLPGD